MKRIPFVFLLAVLLLSACAAAPQTAPVPDVYGYGGATPMEAPMAYEQKTYETSNVAVDGVAVQEREVIENADLAIVVANPKIVNLRDVVSTLRR